MGRFSRARVWIRKHCYELLSVYHTGKMGKARVGWFKYWKANCCIVVLLIYSVATVKSRKHRLESDEVEFEDDYVDEGTLAEIKNAVHIASDRTSLQGGTYTYSYADYDEEHSVERKPVKESFEKFPKHPVILKPYHPPKHYKKKPLSKEKAIMLMFLTKALLVTMFSLGLPAVIGIYALLLAKMIMGLKTIASTNAFTLGMLSTKYVLQKQNKAQKVQQVASLLPFYIPLMLSSLLSAASLISGAAGLIGSLISNSTNSTNSTTTTTTTPSPDGGEEGGRRVEVLHLPMMEVECGPNRRKRCSKIRVGDHPPQPPPENRFSSVTRKATQSVKDFWKRVTKTFKIS